MDCSGLRLAVKKAYFIAGYKKKKEKKKDERQQGADRYRYE